MDMQAVETLAEKLAGGAGEASLTPAERDLAARALVQLAADEAALVKQARLLALHEDSGERIDAILAEAAGVVGEALGRPTAADGYDFDAARQAREDLAEAVADARTARQVIAAALGFVREMAGLA